MIISSDSLSKHRTYCHRISFLFFPQTQRRRVAAVPDAVGPGAQVRVVPEQQAGPLPARARMEEQENRALPLLASPVSETLGG